MSTHKDLASKLDDLERKLGEHDQNFQAVFEPSGNSWHRQWHRPNRESASTRIDIPCPHSTPNHALNSTTFVKKEDWKPW